MKALLIALAGLAAARTTQPQEGVPHKLEPLFAPLVSDGSDRTERSAQGGCFGCSGKTSGPCKSADGACWAYQDVWGKLLCPGAAEECKNDKAPAPPPPSPPPRLGCLDCWGETSGPCKSADGACWEYQDVWGKLLCPGAAEECGNINASPPPSPRPKAFTKLANGADATCVITASQDLYCWGANREAQLGRGNTVTGTAEADTPTKILSSVVDVSFGEEHGCAIVQNETLHTRELYCWGDNYYGQAAPAVYTQGGPSPSTLILTPTLISNATLGGTPWKLQNPGDGGAEHTCVILDEGQKVCSPLCLQVS